MMNVVTSYFVENTIRAVDESRGSNMGQALWRAFTKTHSEDSLDAITSDMFYEHINEPGMVRYLRSLDLVPETCKENHFFELLDSDGSGEVDMQELIHGCLRLRGDAKQIDLHCLGYTVRTELNKIMYAITSLEEAVQMQGIAGTPRSSGSVVDDGYRSNPPAGNGVK